MKVAARKVVADQKREIAQTNSWVKEWAGTEPDLDLHQVMQSDMALIASEAGCKTDRDWAFLIHMRMRHPMAVGMMKLRQAKAIHRTLKELAGTIVTSQFQRTDQFDAWLKEWYPDAVRTTRSR